MAAPSGIVWGSIASGYHKLGIYTKVTNASATKSTVKVEIWLATKYSVNDSDHALYYDITTSATTPSSPTKITAYTGTTVKTTVDSGTGWSTSNHVKIKEYTYEYTRQSTDLVRYVHSKITSLYAPSNSKTVVSASASYTVPKLSTYTISYNANGGSGAPSKQTKTYSVDLTLSSTIPTRSGYNFMGWGTSASDTSVDYVAGAKYTNNAAITLYAIWQLKTYTVSYNANGGSGAPSAQTKKHGATLILSSTKPTRTGYTFAGWSKTSTGSVAYNAGSQYSTNSNITLYAVWNSTYLKPRITSLKATRCDTNGSINDAGTNIKVTFNWATDNDVTSIKIYWRESDDTTWPSANVYTVTGSGKSGSVNEIIGGDAISLDFSYDVRVIILDGGDNTYRSYKDISVNGVKIPIDVKYQNKGIAFGKPATMDNTAEFAYDAMFNGASTFNGNVYGKVYGLSGMTNIPENANLNSYLIPGGYAVITTTIAKTLTNCPPPISGDKALAGRLLVYDSVGVGSDHNVNSAWYRCQEYIPFTHPSKPSYKRYISKSTSSDDINYGDWKRQSGTAVLWEDDTTGKHMNETQKISLTELISDQPSGIVLVFSLYDTSTSKCLNASWNTFFVPKNMINYNAGGFQTFIMGINAGFSVIGAKYLKIYEEAGKAYIEGQQSNSSTGTNSGISFQNNRFVLRRVIGV